MFLLLVCEGYLELYLLMCMNAILLNSGEDILRLLYGSMGGA